MIRQKLTSTVTTLEDGGGGSFRSVEALRTTRGDHFLLIDIRARYRETPAEQGSRTRSHDGSHDCQTRSVQWLGGKVGL